MVNQTNEQLFLISEDELREVYSGSEEGVIETESSEAAKELRRFAKMVDAIGNFRFPHSWGDGLPIEIEDEDEKEYYRQCARDQQDEYDSRWPVNEIPQY